MLYHDFKSRYQILGGSEKSKAKDNKEAAYALMENINFDKQRYRLGHTKVFFRAGALARMEEERDNIVLTLVRWMQGCCRGLLRRRVYNKRKDQRELINVVQRNFRKFFELRNWGWFVIIQKTRPLIGQTNVEEEIRLLEEKVKETYGYYKDQLDTKVRHLFMHHCTT